MLKLYVALLAAIFTAHVFARVGVAAGVLTVVCYLGAFALVDGVAILGRKLLPQTRSPKAGA